MANIKSQIKRNRQNEKRRLRNRIYRGSARTAVKDARAALSTDTSQASVAAAISALDRAAQKGGIHRRNASRRKSRLMKLVSKSTAAQAAAPTTAAKTPAKKASTKKAAAPAKKRSTK